MPGRPELLRLLLALLLSLLVHAVLLLPSGPAGQGFRAAHPTDIEEQALSAELRATVWPHAALVTPAPLPATRPSPSPRADARGHYQAEQLSRAPRPLVDIDLNLPEAALLISPGQMRLTLWIDAEGRVVAYRIDATDLPEEYVAAVAETFAATRYAPGELLGRKVASILTLEIEHEPPAHPGR